MASEVEDLEAGDLDVDEELALEEEEEWEERPIREIHGNTVNMATFGPPSQNEDVRLRYFFYPTWRSQLIPLFGFFLLSCLSIYLSDLPYMIIRGRMFSLFGSDYYLHLPVLVLLPGLMLAKVLIHMYDAKYIIDERGVEAQVGLVSLNLRQPRLRWEDIRGVEPNQSLWERFLGIGTVLIGSAMTNDVEIVMAGVANPRAIQLLIGGERDRHLKRMGPEGFRRMAASD